MLFKWGFKYFSLTKQLDYLREHGIMLGSRMHNNRMVFLYMVKNFFVEVIYQNDNLETQVERLNVFGSINQLNQYLEKEFKNSF